VPNKTKLWSWNDLHCFPSPDLKILFILAFEVFQHIWTNWFHVTLVCVT